MKYAIKRTENFEGKISSELMNEKGWFDNGSTRYFADKQSALDYIDDEKCDPRYQKSYMGKCTFEVVEVED